MLKSKINDNHFMFCLPSEYNSLETYILNNSDRLYDHIIKSIKYAIENDLEFIDIFNFKDSNFVISLDSAEYMKNLKHIYEIYITEEKYELCQEIVDLQNKLKNHNI